MYERARQLEAFVGTPSPQKRQQNGLHLNLKTLNIGLLSCKRPYYAEHTGSRLISLKLSSIEPRHYLNGRPPGNTECCWHKYFFAKIRGTMSVHFFLLLLLCVA